MDEFLKTIVVPCAGAGVRFSKAASKSMIDIDGKPLLYHIIKRWRQMAERWIFVINPSDKALEAFLSRQGISYSVVFQEKRDGIGAAVLRTEKKIGSKFATILGDCLMSGDFCGMEGVENGVGVLKSARDEEISRNYGVQVENGIIIKTEEKPKNPSGLLCGMGAYFFSPAIFDAIRETPPDRNGEIQITSALQTLIDGGADLTPIYFEGRYINVNVEEDIQLAEGIVREQ